MRRIAGTIAMILLETYPLGLSAQVVPSSYPPPAAASNDVTPAAYQQPMTSLALKPPATADHPKTSKLADGLSSVATVGGSLAVVLGIFLLVVWLLRRASPGGTGILPAEAFEMLGRAPLANHQQVHLLRCGNKLLLVAVTGAGAGAATKTLTEITDPAEVDRLAGLCRRAGAGSPVAAFRQVFHQVEEHHV